MVIPLLANQDLTPVLLRVRIRGVLGENTAMRSFVPNIRTIYL